MLINWVSTSLKLTVTDCKCNALRMNSRLNKHKVTLRRLRKTLGGGFRAFSSSGFNRRVKSLSEVDTQC